MNAKERKTLLDKFFYIFLAGIAGTAAVVAWLLNLYFSGTEIELPEIGSLQYVLLFGVIGIAVVSVFYALLVASLYIWLPAARKKLADQDIVKLFDERFTERAAISRIIRKFI